MISSRDERLQSRRSYSLGLQVPSGMEDEVPLPGIGGDVGLRCRELLREIAMSKEMIIYAGSMNHDHVHMLIGIPPQLSVSRAVQYLKGKSSHKLLSEYRQLRKR
jgi:putative transposase